MLNDGMGPNPWLITPPMATNNVRVSRLARIHPSTMPVMETSSSERNVSSLPSGQGLVTKTSSGSVASSIDSSASAPKRFSGQRRLCRNASGQMKRVARTTSVNCDPLSHLSQLMNSSPAAGEETAGKKAPLSRTFSGRRHLSRATSCKMISDPLNRLSQMVNNASPVTGEQNDGRTPLSRTYSGKRQVSRTTSRKTNALDRLERMSDEPGTDPLSKRANFRRSGSSRLNLMNDSMVNDSSGFVTGSRIRRFNSTDKISLLIR